LAKFLIILGLFANYISPLGMISYFVIFFGNIIKFSFFEILAIFYLIFVFIFFYIDSNVDFFRLINIFRFYFGFIVFYLFFKVNNSISFRNILIFLLILIPIETIAINFFIHPQLLPNYPDIEMTSHFSDGYLRPYSFGGNASVSSVLLVVLFLLNKNYLKVRFDFFYILLLSSGSGFLAYAIYKLKFFTVKKIIFILSLIFIILYSQHIEFSTDKLSREYFLYLYDYKYEQIYSILFQDLNFYGFIFGSFDGLDEFGYGGDFGYVYLVRYFGIMGLLIFLIFSLNKINSYNFIPISIMMIFTLHYPVMFFMPGQIIFGYALAKKYE